MNRSMKKAISIAVVITVSFMLFSNVTNTCYGGKAKEASVLKLDVCKKNGTIGAGGFETLLYFEQNGNNSRPIVEDNLKSSQSILYASSHIFIKDRPPRV